jgi:hypothetical protein
MKKEFIKITFEDIEIAERFFDNSKHLNEFLFGVIEYYRGKNPAIKTKIVSKYFETYKKTMDFILQSKDYGFKGYTKKTEIQALTKYTLKGGGEPTLPTNSKVISNKNKEESIKRVKQNPTIEMVIKYFKEKGYSEKSAITAFNYYDSANWFDSKGSKVVNWKQKMIGVWFKPENKEVDKSQPKMVY